LEDLADIYMSICASDCLTAEPTYHLQCIIFDLRAELDTSILYTLSPSGIHREVPLGWSVFTPEMEHNGWFICVFYMGHKYRIEAST
jgi:hypothetical protein